MVTSYFTFFREGDFMKLKTSMLIMAVVPILILGLVITSFSMSSFTDAMYEEVEVELSNVAHTIENTMELAYPGDFVVYGDSVRTLVKGEKILNDNFELIDSIKADTGLDVSVFYGNLRYLTTITDNDGKRLIGTYCNALVEKEVLKTGVSKFYNNIEIDAVKYFSYYLPLCNADGSCVGMVAILKHAEDVNLMVLNAAMPTLLIALVAMVITGFICIKYATKLTRDVNRLADFLKEIGNGKLRPDSGFELIERQDELSSMYKSALMMQRSLRELVEWDALTMLENRRSANKILGELQNGLDNENEKYVLALGDIDYFKKVNDTYGHEAGDAVLKEVANVLRTHMKGKGFASRWGGEEFLLGFKGYNLKMAVEEMNDVLKQIRALTVKHEDKEIKVTMSFGVSAAKAGENIDKQVKYVDEKLYYAKESGRNRLIYQLEGEEQDESFKKVKKAKKKEVDADVLDYIKELNGDDNGRTDI